MRKLRSSLIAVRLHCIRQHLSCDGCLEERLPSHCWLVCHRVVLGRAHVRTVAETRKAELEQFLKYLLKLSPELAQVSCWSLFICYLPAGIYRYGSYC